MLYHTITIERLLMKQLTRSLCTRNLILYFEDYSSSLTRRIFYKSFTTQTNTNFQKDRGKKKQELMHLGYFNKSDKNKESFIEAIRKFKTREKYLRGYVEFIYTALQHLEEFGVHKELEVYKELLDIMPKGIMIPRNIFQAEFFHYPKHQECAIQVLEEMGTHGVMPDSEVAAILENTFGRWSGPTKKFMRMMYWMPKFKHASPWPLPSELPNDTLELAKLAISQICSIEPATKVEVLQTADVMDAVDNTWIVSATSPAQEELIAQHPKNESLKVEGPFGVYLQDVKVGYFVLRAEEKPPPPKPSREEVDNVKNIFIWMSEEESEGKELIKRRTVHEQDDGLILAVCATGTSSRDSLLSWIRLLERKNPALCGIPVLFTQSSPIGDVIIIGEPEKEKLIEETDS